MIKEKKYKVSLTTLEPFRIGAKEDPLSGAENPVAKIGGRLAIPGSSLKGALRTQIESFLIDSYFDMQRQTWAADKKAFQPCIPGAGLSKDEKNLVGKYRDELGSCHYPCTDKNCDKRVKHPICPVCYLLGSMGLNGFVKIPFLFAESSTTEVLQSIRIDRSSGTAAERALRSYELVPDSITFSGDLYILLEDTVLGWKMGNPRPLSDRTLGDAWLKNSKIHEKSQEEFIKTFILDQLESIKRLGGYKSKGFGQIEIKVEHISG